MFVVLSRQDGSLSLILQGGVSINSGRPAKPDKRSDVPPRPPSVTSDQDSAKPLSAASG